MCCLNSWTPCRANAWKDNKSLTSRHGRGTEIVNEALVQFNDMNYHIRQYVTRTRAAHEQRLVDSYAEAPIKAVSCVYPQKEKLVHVSGVSKVTLQTASSYSEKCS